MSCAAGRSQASDPYNRWCARFSPGRGRNIVSFLFAQEGASSDIWWTVAGLVSLPILIGTNAFFVAAEFALVAVRKTRIEEMVARGVKGATFVQSAIEHLDRSIAATQLGITLSSIGLGFFAEQALASALSGVFHGLPEIGRAHVCTPVTFR